MSQLWRFLNVFQMNEETKPSNVFSLLLLNTAIIFFPFLIHSKILLSDTDSLFGHYPNLLFAKEAWDQGTFGLWNPYLFAGMDFSSTMHNHGLSPAFWPIFLFPQEYLLHALTFFMFLCHLTIGCTTFQIARLYLENHYAAFLALSFQLSGFAWFTTTSTIGMPMFAASLITIYLILKAPDKPILQTVIPMSITLPIITLMGHGGYILAFLFPPFVVTLITFWPKSWKGWLNPRLWAIGATFALALVFAGFRLLAVSEFLLNEASTKQGLFPGLSQIFGSYGYYLLTGWIPNLMGYELLEGVRFSQILGLGGRHNQFHIALYYGLILFPLTVGATLAIFGRKAQYAAIVFLIFFISHPIGILVVTDLLTMVFYPFHHEIINRAFAPFILTGVLGLAFYHLKSHTIDKSQVQNMKTLSTLGFGIVLTLVATFFSRVLVDGFEDFHSQFGTIFTQNFKPLIFLLKLSGNFCLVIFLWITYRMVSDDNDKIFKLFVNVAIVLGGLLFLGLSFIFFFNPDLKHTHLLLYGYVYELAASIWAVTLVWLSRRQDLNIRGGFSLPRASLAALSLMVVFLILPIPEFNDHRSHVSTAFASIASVARFLVVGACAIEVFCSMGTNKLSRSTWLTLIFLFSFGEMHCFQKIYSHVGATPFVSKEEIYPNIKSPLLTPITEEDRQTRLTAKNLLSNPNLERDHNGHPKGWSIGGKSPRFSSVIANGTTVFSLENFAEDHATVFQDLEWNGPTGPVAMGVWIKSNAPGTSGILARSETPYNQPSGKWEWIQTPFSVKKGETFRIHLYQKGPGQFDFMGMRLIEGFFVEPLTQPPGPKILPKHWENTDFNQYRANHTGNLPEITHAFSSKAMVHGIPTYGGVDSVVKKDLTEFLKYFEKQVPYDQWIKRFGILPMAQNNRLLDLLSVRYDVESTSKFKVRKNALARFSLFDNFEVQTEKEKTLARLAEPKFDPTRTVILDRDPGWKRISSKSPSRFAVADFESPNFQEINITTEADHSRILLFNDVYSKHWKATWNGQPLPVLKANGIFMAVSLPAGKGRLELTFEPAKFKTWMKISYLTLGGLWIIFLIQIVSRRLARPSISTHST